MRHRSTWMVGVALPLLLACGSEADQKNEPVVAEAPTPPLGALTDEITVAPAVTPLGTRDARDVRVPEDRDSMLADGFGDIVLGDGESYVERVPGGATAPAPGANAKLLVRFAHLPDVQLTDDESPTKLARFDDIVAPAFRPHDAYLCHMLDAMVRTLNTVHSELPLSFVLLGGDNMDNAQKNELDWFLTIMAGGDLECDSGDDDDPVAGPGNDPKDPFTSVGLDVPWYWVTGNHDVLVQGNYPLDQQKQDQVLGTECTGGTRDWSQAGGPMFFGPVVPDERRALVQRPDLMSQVAADGDGHGLGAEEASSGKATYTFDVPGTPLRFLVIDTATSTGGAEGLIRQADIDTRIKPLLDQAQADGKWVALASHHAVGSLGDGTGLGGTQQADAVLEDAWIDFVSSYPNVILSFVGHSHENQIRHVNTGSGGGSWWEVMTAAIADFPHQSRIVEIWDEDNGWVHVHATSVDFSSEGDQLAAEGRALGVLDYVSGWMKDGGEGTPQDRNVDLWIQAP